MTDHRVTPDRAAEDLREAESAISIALGRVRWLKTHFETYASVDPKDLRYDRCEDAEAYLLDARRELQRIGDV